MELKNLWFGNQKQLKLIFLAQYSTRPAVRAFIKLELLRFQELIDSWHEIQRKLSLEVARDFILEHLNHNTENHAHSQISVNA